MPNNAKIDRAFEIAKTPDQSPAAILHGVMSALGFDFGDPSLVETDVMQFYADPARNPFVQARLEASILLDTAHLERLADVVRTNEPCETDRLRAASVALQIALDTNVEDTIGCCLARNVVLSILMGFDRYGANRFNKFFGTEVGRLTGDKYA